MAVNTFFCTLTDIKFVPVNYKSVSFSTGTPSFLLQPLLIWLAVRSSLTTAFIIWMAQFLIISLHFLYFFHNFGTV